MDLFAAILVTITATTLCGICFFIFVCAVQPRFLRKMQRKTSRTFREIDSNENEDERSVKSLDIPIQSIAENSEISNNRDKKAYLKSLERSLRTGGRIQDDDNDSDSNPFKFIRHCINKHVRQKTTDALETTEL